MKNFTLATKNFYRASLIDDNLFDEGLNFYLILMKKIHVLILKIIPKNFMGSSSSLV